MTDKELLELAAKAHGGLEFIDGNGWIEVDAQCNRGYWWDPLTDDGDALRLAVKLGLHVDADEDACNVYVHHKNGKCTLIEQPYEECGDCPYKATRLAIVRAAAAIGELMK